MLRFAIIVANQLTNAKKFMPGGEYKKIDAAYDSAGCNDPDRIDRLLATVEALGRELNWASATILAMREENERLHCVIAGLRIAGKLSNKAT
jgi:hypothetical protein